MVIFHLLIILITSVFFRVGTFFYPHSSWDQRYYVSLAMKLDTGSFADYNLQKVAFRKLPYAQGYAIYKDDNPHNTLLGKFNAMGFHYYDEPLFFEPPLFPYLITWSHHLLSPHQPYIYLDKREWKRIRTNSWPRYFPSNLAYALVPFVFSILSIVLVFMFCKTCINAETGYYAGLLLAVSPAHVMAGTKIWTDSIGLAFYILTLIFFYLAYRRNSVFAIILSGIFAALAVMSRISNLGLLCVLMAYRLYLYKDDFKKSWLGFLDLKALAFTLLFLVLTLPWFSAVIQVYGTPLHVPYQKNFAHFFAFVNFELHRPWYTYAVDIFAQNPVLALSVLLPFFPLEKTLKSMLLIWAVMPLLVLTILPKVFQIPVHDIYALPVYPAMAIGAAYVFQNITGKSWAWLLGGYALLLPSLLWSSYLAVKYTYVLMTDCIPVPL